MMFPGLDRLQLTWRQPYAPILPWVAFVAGLMAQQGPFIVA